MNRTNGWKDAGLALLRVGVGGVFVVHGLQKLFGFGIPGLSGFLGQLGIPFPTLGALAVTAAELLGGLALAAGLFTRLAALPLAFSMLVAGLTVHLKGGFFVPDGVEYVLTLFIASVAISLTGAGAWSVDRVIEARRAARTPAPATVGELEAAMGK